MVPPQARPTRSPGERELFTRLRDDPSTDGWIALHSLDVPVHRTHIAGEADFVVIIPHKGVLVIEVKACVRVRRDNGVWFLGNQPGETRGPFRQAAENMHSLRERLAKARPDLARIPFWSCVIFTHLVFREEPSEWHPWQVLDSTALRSAPIGRLLRHMIERARDHLAICASAAWFHNNSKEPYAEQCEDIAAFFRPDFECLQDYRSTAEEIDAELRHFTIEQLGALDAMETNARVVFKGPAGTGKTVLALESARRAAHVPCRVLLLCYNRLLGAELAKRCEQLALQVRTRTIHAHMLDVAGLKPPYPLMDSDFWENELPRRAVEVLLLEDSARHTFDRIIIDEAQDLLRTSYLDFLDLSLTGGLSAGSWWLFGDFDRQAIYGSANLTLDDFYDRLSSRPSEYSLRVNCRNTPSVASLAEMLGGLSPGYSRVLRAHDGIEPTYLFYENPQEQLEHVEGALSDLFAAGLSASDIVILSARSDDISAAANLPTPAWKQRVRRFNGEPGGYVRYCSIHAFKGLEARAIIVTDLDGINGSTFESLIYIAVTRAVHRVVVIIANSLRAELLTRHEEFTS